MRGFLVVQSHVAYRANLKIVLESPCCVIVLLRESVHATCTSFRSINIIGIRLASLLIKCGFTSMWNEFQSLSMMTSATLRKQSKFCGVA